MHRLPPIPGMTGRDGREEPLKKNTVLDTPSSGLARPVHLFLWGSLIPLKVHFSGGGGHQGSKLQPLFIGIIQEMIDVQYKTNDYGKTDVGH